MRLLAFLLAVMTIFTSLGMDRADSVKIYFRVGQRQFDPALGENRAVMEDFVGKIRDAVAADNIERIVVHGYASPDGPFVVNKSLACHRCETIADYIVTHAGVSRDLVEQLPEGIAWDELRCLVAEHPEVPSREEVLGILDNVPVWIFDATGKIVSGRKKRLMDLRGGRPYNWLLANLFPLLRNGVGVVFYLKGQPANEPEPAGSAEETTDLSEPLGQPGQPERLGQPELSDPSVLSAISDLPDQPEPAESPDLSGPADQPESAELAVSTDATAAGEAGCRRYRFALKNNILYDAVLMPNLELEWLINNRWSVALEGDVAWWKPRENRVYRLAVVSPEVRYRISPPRDFWHGLYVGAFVGGGLYQLENGGEGYRGEGGMAGLSCGYMWPLGKRFFMEAALGAGYMYTRYKVYEPRDGHRLYMRTKSLNYFGPLKVKLSVAWTFGAVSKPSKANPSR